MEKIKEIFCLNCNREIKESHPCFHLPNGCLCMACEFKEITVWYLSLKGEGNYMVDRNKENLQHEIDEDDCGNEYDLTKHKMKVMEYYNLLEFEGF